MSLPTSDDRTVQLSQQEVYDYCVRGLNWNKNRFPKKYKDIAVKDFAKYMFCIAELESNRRPYVTNKSGTARGLFQIVRATRQNIEKHKSCLNGFNYSNIDKEEYDRLNKLGQLHATAYDPYYSAILASNYFLYQYKRYNESYYKACRAYNQGNASNKNGIPYANNIEKRIKKTNFDTLEKNCEYLAMYEDVGEIDDNNEITIDDDTMYFSQMTFQDIKDFLDMTTGMLYDEKGNPVEVKIYYNYPEFS